MEKIPGPFSIKENEAGVFYLNDVDGRCLAKFFALEDGIENEERRSEAQAIRKFIVRSSNSFVANLKAMNDAYDALRDGQSQLATKILGEVLGYEPRSEN